MAKSNNGNGIYDNDIQKTKEYADALDKLHSSLTEVNSTLPSFADGIDAGLKAVASKLPDVVNSMMKLNQQNKELAANGQKPISIFSQLASSVFSWNSAISVGVTLLTTYGGAFLKWASDMLKGQTTLSALAKAMKDQGIITEALISVKLNADKAAQKELVTLKALYNATQSQNSSVEQKLDAAKALKEQWPETFGQLKEETIIAGNAAKAYGELKDRIMDAAYAEAAKNRITANASRHYDDQFKIENERKKNEKLRKELNELNNDRNSEEQNPSSNSYGTLNGIASLKKILDKKNQLKASDKIIYDNVSDQLLLSQQNEKLYHEIEKRVNSSGVGVLGYKRPAPAKHDNNTATNNKPNNSDKDQTDTIGGMAKTTLDSYTNEIEETNKHFDDLKKLNGQNSAVLKQIEQQRLEALKQINDKFQQDGLEKLNGYQKQLQQIALENTQDAIEKLHLETKQKTDELDKQSFEIVNRITDQQHDVEELKNQGKTKEAKILEAAIEKEMEMLKTAGKIREALLKQQSDKELTIQKDKAKEDEQKQNKDQQDNIYKLEQGGQHTKALQLQLLFLKEKHDAEIKNSQLTHEQIKNLDEDYAKQKAELEDKLTESKIHAGDKYINAVLANSKKDSAIYKAAFIAKKATSVSDTIISTKQAIIDSLKAYSGIPFIGQALGIAQAAFMAAQGASSIATIIQQKPGFAKGGHYLSDGKGALLPGYSRTDNTNAYLRSGEAVVVSEAMRNPWARNLVSAINVAHGGRDFSTRSNSRGYAIGGIFTDGGNANRYYNQPVNDVKDLANTLAYQMINNFPPIYVDVKDVNNQQNILAQTVNRVDL